MAHRAFGDFTCSGKTAAPGTRVGKPGPLSCRSAGRDGLRFTCVAMEPRIAQNSPPSQPHLLKGSHCMYEPP